MGLGIHDNECSGHQYCFGQPTDDIRFCVTLTAQPFPGFYDRTWTVEVTILPPKVWISNNKRVEFDNEEDCDAYNNEQLLLDMQRERDQEDERWKEEYDRRIKVYQKLTVVK